MRDYLVFQLYGPLASWGDIAVGETRPSSFAPTKSAVLGLIAAALGLRRPDTTTDEPQRRQWDQEHQALAAGYGMATKITLFGLPVTDFHTAEVPRGTGYATRRDEIVEVYRQKKSGVSFKGTILSRRDYRQDAFAGVALWARDGAPYPLTALRERLLKPEFVLYLGRKSCPPALPLNPRIHSADDIESALADCSLTDAIKGVFDGLEITWITRKLDESRPLFCWDSDAQTRLTTDMRITRRDQPTSRRRWQFTVREEYRTHPQGGDSA